MKLHQITLYVYDYDDEYDPNNIKLFLEEGIRELSIKVADFKTKNIKNFTDDHPLNITRDMIDAAKKEFT